MFQRLAFLILALGLVANPAAAQITRVSVATGGAQGNGPSTRAVLSVNGRFVVFESTASNLVAGDTNGAKDIFVRDLVANVTTRVSVASDGSERNADSVLGDISDDGNLVVFESRGAFVAGDANSCDDAGTTVNCTDVYVHDRATAQTTLVSIASDGTQGSRGGGSPSITADGRFVGFLSSSSNLVAGDTNGVADAFLHDRVLHTTVRVSLGSQGQQATTGVSAMALSKDGRMVGLVGDVVMFGGPPLNGDCFVASVCQRAFFKTLATGAVAMPPLSEFQIIAATSWTVTGVGFTSDGRQASVDSTSRGGHSSSSTMWLYELSTWKVVGGGTAGPRAFSADARYQAMFSPRKMYEGPVPTFGPPEPIRITDRISGLVEAVPNESATLTADLYPQSFDSPGRYLAFYSAEPTLVAGDTNGVEDVFLLDRDPDADGMPSFWETWFGLDPNNAADAGADPDGDGLTNLQEFQANTLPIGVHKRSFAEGASNTFFTTRVAILNPGDTAANVGVELQGPNGHSTSWILQIPAKSRLTYYPEYHNLPDEVFSIVLESDQPVVADRLVTWDATGYGSHLETAIEAPGTSWYFAEGATGGPYSLYYLLQNPGAADATATVTYLRPTPLAPITKTYRVAAHSRKTIDVRGEDAGLAAGEVSGQITSDLPIVAERALYYSTPTQFQAAGHDGAGIAAPALRWFLAEGATGFFDEYVLIANADASQDANITVTYLLEDGVTFSESIVAKKQSRFTLELKARDARLQSTPVSVVLESTNAVPVVAERVMWWPHGNWYEASLSAGTTATGTRWVVAEGEQGGLTHASTYVLIANTDTTDATVKVTLVYDGPQPSPTEEKTFTVKAHSRVSVDVGAEFSQIGLYSSMFGIIVESDGPQIVVERALYASPNGVLFDAGATSVATRLPLVP